jgi:hypothetical protein
MIDSPGSPVTLTKREVRRGAVLLLAALSNVAFAFLLARSASQL